MKKNKKPVQKTAKPIFLEDSDGKLYKAMSINDEDVPLDDPVEEDEELVTVQLTKAQYDKLMALLGDEAVNDEDPKEEGDKKEEEEEDDEDKVVDTKDSKFVKSSTSIETKKQTTVEDSVEDVDAAWSRRYANKK